MNKNIIKDAAMLTLITLIAGLFLGFVYQITKEPIIKQQALDKQNACKAVFEDASQFVKDDTLDISNAPEVLVAAGYSEESIDEVLVAQDSSGNALGYVMTVTTSEGYGGDIIFSLGIKADGTVNGYEILTINETAGLGMKAKEAAFKGQFSNKLVDSFKYTKTGATADNEIDAITGATITTNAVTNGVNAGIAYFNSIKEGGTINE
ncbi:MAG: RnfABCDGE type electron transport complex subunit G [Lachnotalea sp.]